MRTATRPQAHLGEVAWPEFGMPEIEPTLPPALFALRLERFQERMDARGYDHVVIWADREHSANVSYLTGFDPRFEDAIVVVGRQGEPTILVGNECLGMAAAAPLPMHRVLYQDLSLPSQPRDESRPLAEIMREAGIATGHSVGLIGWKTYASPRTTDLPAYVVDLVRELAGPASVENATDIMINASDGLRVVNEIEQLAAFEWAACQTSNAVGNVLAGLRPGITERDAARLLEWNGTPLSCHLMLTAGPRARLGLLSPGDREIERGDPFTIAFGIWGALNCRAGFVVENAAQLPPGVSDYVDRLVAPYFEAIAAWYGELHVGQRGGALQAVIDDRLGDPFFGISLNPGHQLHLDEWVNSPVFAGSTIELRSGMALQCDVIPATGTPYFTTNIEDGVVLADDAMRGVLAIRYPSAWSRIQARREFMREALGIDLHPDVLPLSNLAARLPPFLLRPDLAMTLAA